MPDILFIILLALVVFGPKRLPQIAAQVGKYMRQFQSIKRELLDQVNVEVLQLEKEKQSVVAQNAMSPATEPGPGQQAEVARS